MSSEPIDLMIWGSCVSRDSVEFFPADSYKIRRYVARQSLISANKPVSNPESLELTFPSKFQTRMYKSDLAGNALEQIAAMAKQCDNPLLIVDLMDERGGILEGPDGSVITTEPNAVGRGVLNKVGPSWNRHLFSSLEYFFRLAKTLPSIQRSLEEMGIWDRTYLLPARWAEIDDQGNPTKTILFKSVQAANEHYGDVYEMFSEAGWKSLPIEDLTPVAKVGHQWGLAPFHYTDDYYKGITREILAIN